MFGKQFNVFENSMPYEQMQKANHKLYSENTSDMGNVDKKLMILLLPVSFNFP